MGHLKTINFPFGTNGKLLILGVPMLKHITVYPFTDVDYGKLVEASDRESESEDEEKQIEKYKQLLQDIDKKEDRKKDKDVQMEITWEPGLFMPADKFTQQHFSLPI